MQQEQEEVDNQDYSDEFYGKKLIGNRVPLIAITQGTLAMVISPRFQCTCLTDPITDFLREVSAVR